MFWILFPKMTLGDGPKMLPIGVKMLVTIIKIFDLISFFINVGHQNSKNATKIEIMSPTSNHDTTKITVTI